MYRHLAWKVTPGRRNEGQGRKESQCGHVSLIWPWLQAAGGASQVAPVVKNPSTNAGDVRDMALISGSRRSPGGGYDNPLQYSCLVHPMDRGACPATVHEVTKSRTRLKRLSMHTPVCSALENYR